MRAARSPICALLYSAASRGSARIGVARLADVVEREHRAARADTDPLEDPRLGRADVELLEESVTDLVVGVEVPQAVQVEAHASSAGSALLAPDRYGGVLSAKLTGGPSHRVATGASVLYEVHSAV